MWLIELTVCYETNTVQAEARKRERYTDLANNIKRAGYKCYIRPLQAGSRGYIDLLSFKPIKEFLKVKATVYLTFLTKMSYIVIDHFFMII